MEKFSEKLSEFIRQQGLSKNEFGIKIGSGRQAVLNYTNGRDPSLSFLLKIVDHYPDFDLNYFLKDNILKPSTFSRVKNYSEFQEEMLKSINEVKLQNQIIINTIIKDDQI